MYSFRIRTAIRRIALLSLLTALPAAGAASFQRGDANDDGALDIGDPISVLAYLFAQGTAPRCMDAADGNDDGTVDLGDAVKVLGHLFAGTGDLPLPFGACGVDPTEDPLDCAGYSHCGRGGPRVVHTVPAGGETSVSVRAHVAL